MRPSTRIVEDLGDIEPRAWQRLVVDRPGLRLEYLEALASTGNDIGRFIVFLVEDHTGLAAAALCRAIETPRARNTLDSYLFGRGARLAHKFGVSTGSLLFCSEPLDIRCSLVVRPDLSPAFVRPVLGRLLDDMETAAAARGWALLFRGVVADDDADLLAELRARRYLETLSPPTTRLDVSWQDLDGYLAHLRKRSQSAARNVRREIRRNQDCGVTIRRVAPNAENAMRFHASVREHYRRKNGVDPPYPAELFRSLVQRLPEDFIIVEAVRGQSVLGMCSVLRSGSAAWSNWVGLSAQGDAQDFTYFNLNYYHWAVQAAALGVRRLNYGTTAYAAKLNRGCELVPTRMFYRPRTAVARALARPYLRFHEAWYGRKYP
jgi:predicted N-acyltransferase